MGGTLIRARGRWVAKLGALAGWRERVTRQLPTRQRAAYGHRFGPSVVDAIPLWVTVRRALLRLGPELR